ncbi:alpha/beta hydrolase [Planctomicrobium sp. SH661]|uniref:alpha/beta hydrolase n=1 Tax=Planctomicrobium sp. SH661 TaxID=3448124 RepID=UPI003F5BBC2D
MSAGLGLGVCLLSLGVLLLFVGLQRSMIYAARKGAVPLASPLLPADSLSEVLVSTPDGVTLHGWLSRTDSPLNLSSRPLVILFPGNAGNRASRAPVLQDFNRCGCDALICDYRGYAENEGQPSEKAFIADAHAIWNEAVQRLGYSPDQIVLCGQSLGGGVAVQLAADLTQAGTPPAGLILRATFTSLTDAAKFLYPWLPVRTFLIDRYDSLKRIGEITCPVLVIHGKQDTIVPYSQGEKLFAAAPATSSHGIEKTFLSLPGSGHNDLQLTAAGEIHQAHSRFLSKIFAADSASPASFQSP